MSSIVLTGLAANDPLPGAYLEINFAQGPATLGNTVYAAMFLGNKLSTGSATADTVIYGPNSNPPLASEQDAINLFGQGSEMHRMIRRFLAVNNVTPIYAVVVTESGGTAASLAITIATNATAAGNVRTWVGAEFIDTAVTSGDSVTTIATNIVANIKSQLNWAVTATNSSGVITITAKQKGPRGNWLRGFAVVTGCGSTTSSVTAPTFFTSGATADSSTTALATINPYRYYYIVSAAEDATQFGALVTQVNANALPLIGLRQRAIAGSVDTAGNVNTIATGINAARAEVVWLAKGDWTPSELAANAVGIYALTERTRPSWRTNLAFYGNDAVTQATWKVPAPLSGDAPTRAQLVAALNSGVTPVGVNTNGTTYLVDRITTRSLSGALADYRIRDAHKVTVCDFYGDDLLSVYGARFTGKQIGDDPKPGQRVPSTQVVTPRVVKAATNKVTREYGDADMLQNVDAIVADTDVQRETSPTTRMSVRVPLQPIDNLKQVACQINQVA